jgi:hypothetical protein
MVVHREGMPLTTTTTFVYILSLVNQKPRFAHRIDVQTASWYQKIPARQHYLFAKPKKKLVGLKLGNQSSIDLPTT